MRTSLLGRRPWLRTPALPALALLASTLSARAGVLVVDQAAGPGSDFTTIQAAVDAAADGDTILVRDGTYPPFRIDGKGLSVVADGAGVTVDQPSLVSVGWNLLVFNLSSAQEVLVRGLQTDSGIGIVDCAGAVWVDQLVVTGEVFCGVGGSAGAVVARSAKVTFTRCSLRGESNSDIWFTHPSAPGVQVDDATVQLYDCSVQGGWGQDAQYYAFTPQPGGAGLRINRSTVTVVGCTITGGEGGLAAVPPGGSFCDLDHAIGGPGVRFVAGTGTLSSAESTAVGGAASLEPLCPGESGPQGPPIAGSGTIVALPGYARHLQASSPVRGGETLTFQVEGQPGEVPLLLVSLEHEPLPLLAYSGVLLVGLPPEDTFVLGALPASGQGSLSFPVPNVGASVGALTFYAQAAFLDPAPRVWLGAGTSVVLLETGS